jgi:hypothetical protein
VCDVRERKRGTCVGIGRRGKKIENEVESIEAGNFGKFNQHCRE